MRKNAFATLAAGIMVFSLAACGDDGGAEGSPADDAGETTDAGDNGNDDDAAADDISDVDGKIAVLLPDSKSSARWETADRVFFEEAFQDAGLTEDDYIISNAEGDPSVQATQA